MKKILAILLAVALLLTCMVGCSSNTSSSSSSAADSSSESKSEATESSSEESSEATTSDAAWDTTKQDEIVVSVINMYYTSGWKYMAEEYMKLHPETTVTIDVVADNDSYTQKMTTWLTADDFSDAADIVHINFAAGPVGGYNIMFDKDMCYDFADLLDTTNPYTGAAVRDSFEDGTIEKYTTEDGIYALPFDHVGVAVMYNLDLLEANGLSVPTTQEEWIAACETLKANGMETPVACSAEADWYVTSLADAALRDSIGSLLIQPEDGAYDATTMSANDGFVWNESDWTCDADTVMSGERKAMYELENQFTDPVSISVWTEYQKIAQYFTPNYIQANSSDVLTSFEMQNSAFFISGSWNVGALLSDINDMGADGFEWGTMGFPDFATVPDNFDYGTIRSLYVMGNTMGIIKTGDDDHLARVLDFYMYVYCKDGCISMFEQTMNNGYWIQGPAAIKGVELDESLQMKLDGFIQEGTQNGNMGELIGSAYLSSDSGTYIDARNALVAGTMDVETYCATISPLCLNNVNDTVEKQGYDLDPSTDDVPLA